MMRVVVLMLFPLVLEAVSPTSFLQVAIGKVTAAAPQGLLQLSAPNGRSEDVASSEQLREAPVELRSHLHAEVEGELRQARAILAHEIQLHKRGIIAFGLVAISVVLALAILALLAFGANEIIRRIVGEAMELFLSQHAPKMLGVEVKFESVRVQPFLGRAQVGKMTVCNPSAEPPYTTPYLFHTDEVTIDVDMKELICTCMSNIKVQELVFNGARFVYEKEKVLSSKSNVTDVLDHLRQRSKLKDQDVKKPEEEAQEQKDKPSEQNEKKRSFIINKLDLELDAAEANIKGISTSLSLPSITSEDFSKECNGTDIEDIVFALAEKFAQALVSSAENEAGGALKSAEIAVAAAENKIAKAMHSVF